MLAIIDRRRKGSFNECMALIQYHWAMIRYHHLRQKGAKKIKFISIKSPLKMQTPPHTLPSLWLKIDLQTAYIVLQLRSVLIHRLLTSATPLKLSSHLKNLLLGFLHWLSCSSRLGCSSLGGFPLSCNRLIDHALQNVCSQPHKHNVVESPKKLGLSKDKDVRIVSLGTACFRSEGWSLP